MTFQTLPLRRVFRIVNGGTPTGGQDNWNGGISWATPADLASVHGGVLCSTARTITRQGLNRGSRSVPADSLVVSTRAPIGYVCETTVQTAFNQGCRGLTPRIDCDIRFFRYQLSVMEQQLQALGQGSTFMELSTDGLASILVTMPPVGEQRAIADYLDTETARIDTLISKKRRLIALLEERWVTSVLEATRPTTNDGDTAALTRLVDSTIGGSWGSESGEDEVDVLCVRGTDFNTAELGVNSEGVPLRGFSHQEFLRRRLRDGDLLIEKSGGGDKQPVGRVVRWRGEDAAVPTNFAARIRPVNWVDHQFLAFVFRAAYEVGLTRAWIKQTTGIQNLDLSGLLSEKWPIPPLERQREIARQLDKATDDQNQVTTQLRRQIDLLAERRRALITAVVTGDLPIPGSVA